MTQAVLHSLNSEGYQNWTWNSMISPKKINVFKTSKKDDSSHCIIKFKLLSESDDLSGLIGSISHDDLNSLNDLNSLLDLKITKKCKHFVYWVGFLASATWTASFCGIDH